MRIEHSRKSNYQKSPGPQTHEYHVFYRRRDRFGWCILHAAGPWAAYLQLRASFPREDVEILSFHEAFSC
jgi:hypothetical protein